MIRETPVEVQTAIQAAPATVTNEELAAQLGVSLTTVKKYRRLARELKREAAREVVAEHVERETRSALDQLVELRSLLLEDYKTGKRGGDPGNPKTAQALVQALALELKVSNQQEPPDPFAGMTDAELEALADGRAFSLNSEGSSGAAGTGAGGPEAA